MTLPAWDDPNNGGTMVRGALWLLQVVGEGNTFTKNELRDAFPGVSQADRRVRALRDYGWVLHTSSEDASLLREDQRFVRAGVAVWDPSERRAHAPENSLTSKERQSVLSRDQYMCTLCGIAGGEPYPDDPVMTAVLAVSRRLVSGSDGRDNPIWVTECKRCRSGDAPAPVSPREVAVVARDLAPEELRRLRRWMERGRRGTTPLDRAWATYLRVPIDERPHVLDSLRELS